MRLLRRLTRSVSPAAAPRVKTPASGRIGPGQVLRGRETLKAVGESYYQPALCRICNWTPGGEKVSHNIVAVLVLEPDNPYDKNAIAVRIDGQKVGHLSRGDAERYGPGVRRLMADLGDDVALAGVIAGGGYYEGRPGLLGVFLNHDPADFGL